MRFSTHFPGIVAAAAGALTAAYIWIPTFERVGYRQCTPLFQSRFVRVRLRSSQYSFLTGQALSNSAETQGS